MTAQDLLDDLFVLLYRGLIDVDVASERFYVTARGQQVLASRDGRGTEPCAVGKRAVSLPTLRREGADDNPPVPESLR